MSTIWTTLIERKQFASVADAVAFFLNRGFTDWCDGSEERMMRRDNEEVRIVERGSGDVEATWIAIVGI